MYAIYGVLLKVDKMRDVFLKTKIGKSNVDGLGGGISSAEQGCKTCKGHGMVDVGMYACELEHCPDCWTDDSDGNGVVQPVLYK